MKKILNEIFKIFLALIPNKFLRAKLKADWTKFHLKKYALLVKEEKLPPQEPEEPVIFQYWEQGFDKAPFAVQKCLASIARFEPDMKRVLLDYKSIENYVEIPSYIYDLKLKGKIGRAHFADILRSALLAEHPCCWIDSTIFLTGAIPNYIKNEPFFMYKGVEKSPEMFAGANFFFWSKCKNNFTVQLRNSLYRYLKENDFFISYFLHSHLITLLAAQNKDIWDKIPVYDERLTLQLAPVLFQKFNGNNWEKIKNTCPIHKLTYKIPKNAQIQGTYFEKILGGENG